MKEATEIVINSTRLSQEQGAVFYEFVLGLKLEVLECGYLESLSLGQMKAIVNPAFNLYGELFELNHVRVNPEMNNTYILANLSQSLEESGVKIVHSPHINDIKMCFKPLGELSDIVRFYINARSQLTFLSSSVKLHVISCQKG